MNSTEYNIGELSTFLLLTVHHSQYTHRLYFSVSVDRHWKRVHLTDCSAWTKHSTEYKHPHKLDYKVVFVFVNTENANNQQNKPSNNRKLHGLELVLNSQLHKSTFTVHENATKRITAQARVTRRLQLTDIQTRELGLSSTLETLVCKKQI